VGTPCSGQVEHRARARIGRDGRVGAAAITQAERVNRDVQYLSRSLRRQAGGARMANRAGMANGERMANRARMAYRARMANGARMAQGRTQSLA